MARGDSGVDKCSRTHRGDVGRGGIRAAARSCGATHPQGGVAPVPLRSFCEPAGGLARWPRLAGLTAEKEVFVCSLAGGCRRHIEVLGACGHLAWSTDSSLLFAYSDVKRLALRYDLCSGAVTTQVSLTCFDAVNPEDGPPPPVHHSAAFSPDGRWLARIDADERLGVYSLHSQSWTRGPSPGMGPWYARGLQWSPDGEYLLVTRQGQYKRLPGELYRRDNGFSTSVSLYMVHHPSWSPDGRHLAFYDGTGVVIWDLSAGYAALCCPGTIDITWSFDGSLCELGAKRSCDPSWFYEPNADWTLVGRGELGGKNPFSMRIYDGQLEYFTSHREPTARKLDLAASGVATEPLQSVASVVFCPGPGWAGWRLWCSATSKFSSSTPGSTALPVSFLRRAPRASAKRSICVSCGPPMTTPFSSSAKAACRWSTLRQDSRIPNLQPEVAVDHSGRVAHRASLYQASRWPTWRAEMCLRHTRLRGLRPGDERRDERSRK